MKKINFKSCIEPIHLNYFSSVKALEELYYRQKDILLKDIQLPSDHSFKTYRLINKYLYEDIQWKKNYLVGKYEIAPLSGLLLYVNHSNLSSIINDNKISEKITTILSAHRYFYHQLLTNYIKYTKDRTSQFNYFETSDNDYKYSRLIHDKINQLFKNSQSLINTFYLVLFFDLLSTFSHVANVGSYTNSFKSIAFFVLHVLPMLVGTYRYGNFSSLLRDYAFKIIDEKKYSKTIQLIAKGSSSKSFISEIKKHLTNISNLNKFPTQFAVFERRKGIYSSFVKSLKYNLPVENLWDLYAIRIIIESDKEGHCYEMLTHLEEKWERWNNKKGYYDYIANPKKNKYKSIHTVLKSQKDKLVEVQIRTSLMHFIAEFGSASHQTYKHTFNKAEKTTTEHDPIINRGKSIIEQYLKSNGLSLNDYIDHLKLALEHVPIEHYYEGIAKKQYDPQQIVNAILFSGRKK